MRTSALIFAAAAAALAALAAPLARSADIQATAPGLATTMDAGDTESGVTSSSTTNTITDIGEVHAAGRVVMRTPEDPDADAAGIKILAGTQDRLREPKSEPAALVLPATSATPSAPKTTLAEPTIAISRSNVNVILSPSNRDRDRLSLVDVIERLIRSRGDMDDTSDKNKYGKYDKSDKIEDDDTRLTTAILAVVGARASDERVMTMVRAVLGCREHPEMMRKCIVALVQSTQPSVRSGVRTSLRASQRSGEVQSADSGLDTSETSVSPDSDSEATSSGDEYFGRRTVVANPRGPGFAAKRTTVVNPRGPGFAWKRTAVVGGRRRFYPETSSSSSVVASDATDASVTQTNEILVMTPAYRVVFLYPAPRGRGRYMFGWRYPLGYWNAFGRRLYPARCGFGRAIGDSYYC